MLQALRMASDRRHIACNRFCKIAQEIFKQDKKHPDMPYFKNEADLWEIDMAKAAILLEGECAQWPHVGFNWHAMQGRGKCVLVLDPSSSRASQQANSKGE